MMSGYIICLFVCLLCCGVVCSEVMLFWDRVPFSSVICFLTGRFLNPEFPSMKLRSIERLRDSLPILQTPHGNEGKAPRAAGAVFVDNIGLADLSVLGEFLVEVLFGDVEAEVADV